MSEWSDWIEHDGKHKPADGLFVEREYANGIILAGIVGCKIWTSGELGCPKYQGETFSCSWVLTGWGLCVPVIRYRIRKPRGLTILENLIADLPAPTRKVDA